MDPDTSLLSTSNGRTQAAPKKWTHEEIRAGEKIINEQIKAEDDDSTLILSPNKLWIHCSQQLAVLGFNRSPGGIERQFRGRLKLRARSPSPTVDEASKVRIKEGLMSFTILMESAQIANPGTALSPALPTQLSQPPYSISTTTNSTIRGTFVTI
jgi:hypothetical protein